MILVQSLGLSCSYVGDDAHKVHPARRTVISLTFDDGTLDQYALLKLLSDRDMKATVYVNSGIVNVNGKHPGYLNWSQLHRLAQQGIEIGGHTIHHPHLPSLVPSKQRREICGDRANLIDHGFDPISFAYPYADFTRVTERLVEACGYLSARAVGGIDCAECDVAETIPPLHPYALRTPDDVEESTSLQDLKSEVRKAEEARRAWLVLTMHHICKSCSTLAVSRSKLERFLDWLQGRSARGTVVRTVGDVMMD